MAKKITDLGDGVELRDDGSCWKDSRKARKNDLRPRNDLPQGHPLRGERVAMNVPAGMGDLEITDDGNPAPRSVAASAAVVEEKEKAL